MQRIESTLQELRPPRWPEDLLGAIDREKAARGKPLFEQHCQGCHGPHIAVDAIKKRDAPLKTASEPMWLISAKDIRDIGTDPLSALNFTTNELDLSRTGLDPQAVRALLRKQLVESQRRSIAAIAELQAEVERLKRQGAAGTDLLARTQAALGYAEQGFKRYLTDERIQQSLDRLDLRKVTSGVGLNILGLIIRDRFYTERAFSTELRDCYEGFGMLDIPQVAPGLQAPSARGCVGDAAVPPQRIDPQPVRAALSRLRALAHLLRRAARVRSGEGRLRHQRAHQAGVLFDTRLPGNANTGHEFRAGYVPFDERHPERVQFGVIGPELTPDERWEIIEYLKVHSDEPDGTSRPAAASRSATPRRHELQTAGAGGERRHAMTAPQDESAEDPPADCHRRRAGVGGPRRRDDRRRARPGHHGHGGSDSCE